MLNYARNKKQNWNSGKNKCGIAEGDLPVWVYLFFFLRIITRI